MTGWLLRFSTGEWFIDNPDDRHLTSWSTSIVEATVYPSEAAAAAVSLTMAATAGLMLKPCELLSSSPEPRKKGGA